MFRWLPDGISCIERDVTSLLIDSHCAVQSATRRHDARHALHSITHNRLRQQRLAAATSGPACAGRATAAADHCAASRVSAARRWH
jgi:hypothetical protein